MGLFNLFNRSNKNSIKEKTYEENGYTIGVDSHIIYHVPKLQGSHVYAFPNGTTGLSKTAVMEMRDSALRQIIVPGSFKKFNVELELLNFEYLVLVELQEGVEEVHCIFDPNIDVILPTTRFDFT